MSALKVIRPLAIGAAQVIASNVPEDDYPAWVTGTSYDLDVRVVHEHLVWRSAVAANAGNNPTASPDKWVKVGTTNRYKAFDASVSTQTAQAGSITYQLRMGQSITAVALLNLTGATSVRVRVVDATLGEVYDRTVTIRRAPVEAGWWSWFFGERRVPTQAIFQGIPGLPGADVHIEIAGTADLAVGVIAVGSQREFSMGVQMGARVGIQDYSRKDRNEYGDLIVVQRGFAKRASFSLMLRASEVDALQQFLADVRAQPCLWIGSGRYEATTIYGPYKSFEIAINYFDYSDCDLELEGLT